MERIMEEQQKVEVEKQGEIKNFYSPFVQQFREEVSWDYGSEKSRKKAVELIAHFLSLKYPMAIPYKPIMAELNRQLGSV